MTVRKKTSRTAPTTGAKLLSVTKIDDAEEDRALTPDEVFEIQHASWRVQSAARLIHLALSDSSGVASEDELLNEAAGHAAKWGSDEAARIVFGSSMAPRCAR